MDVETEMHFLMDSKQVGTIYLLKLNSEDVFKIYNSAQDKQKICKNIFVRKPCPTNLIYTNQEQAVHRLTLILNWA